MARTSPFTWLHIACTVVVLPAALARSQPSGGPGCPAPIDLGYGITINLWPDPPTLDCQRITVNPGEGPPNGGPVSGVDSGSDAEPPQGSFNVVLSGFGVSEQAPNQFGHFVAREMSGAGQPDGSYRAQDNGLGGVGGTAKSWHMTRWVGQEASGRYPFLDPLPHHTIDGQQVEDLDPVLPDDGVWFHSDPRPIVLSRQWLNGVWVTQAVSGMPPVPMDIRSDRQVYLNLKPWLALNGSQIELHLRIHIVGRWGKQCDYDWAVPFEMTVPDLWSFACPATIHDDICELGCHCVCKDTPQYCACKEMDVSWNVLNDFTDTSNPPHNYLPGCQVGHPFWMQELYAHGFAERVITAPWPQGTPVSEQPLRDAFQIGAGVSLDKWVADAFSSAPAFVVQSTQQSSERMGAALSGTAYVENVRHSLASPCGSGAISAGADAQSLPCVAISSAKGFIREFEANVGFVRTESDFLRAQQELDGGDPVAPSACALYRAYLSGAGLLTALGPEAFAHTCLTDVPLRIDRFPPDGIDPATGERVYGYDGPFDGPCVQYGQYQIDPNDPFQVYWCQHFRSLPVVPYLDNWITEEQCACCFECGGCGLLIPPTWATEFFGSTCWRLIAKGGLSYLCAEAWLTGGSLGGSGEDDGDCVCCTPCALNCSPSNEFPRCWIWERPYVEVRIKYEAGFAKCRAHYYNVVVRETSCVFNGRDTGLVPPWGYNPDPPIVTVLGAIEVGRGAQWQFPAPALSYPPPPATCGSAAALEPYVPRWLWTKAHATDDLVYACPSNEEGVWKVEGWGNTLRVHDPGPNPGTPPPSAPFDQELHAPYRGPVDSWREASMGMSYGEIVNVAVPCGVTGAITTTWPTFAGSWDRSVVRLYEGSNAAGAEIMPGANVTVPLVEGNVVAGDHLIHFSVKAIGIRSEQPYIFPVNVRSTQNGNAAKTYEFTVKPTTVGSPPAGPEGFRESAALLQLRAGPIQLDVPAGLKFAQLGRNQCKLRIDDPDRDGDPNDALVTASFQLPGQVEFTRIPHVSQFNVQCTPWPGHIAPGWRCDYTIDSQTHLHKDPNLIAPDGTVYKFNRNMGHGVWELSAVYLPGRETPITYTSTLEAMPGGAAFDVLTLADIASGSSIKVYRSTTAGVDSELQILQAASVKRRWTVKLDTSGWIAELTPEYPGNGAGKRSFTHSPDGRLTAIKNGPDESMYEFGFGIQGLIFEKCNIDGGPLKTVVQHDYGIGVDGHSDPDSVMTRYFTGPGELGDQRDRVLTYRGVGGAAGGQLLVSSTLLDYHNPPGPVTGYVWDENHPKGNVGIRTVDWPDGSGPDLVTTYAGTSPATLPFVTKIERVKDQASHLTLYDADVSLWNNMLPRVDRLRDGFSTPNITRLEYDNNQTVHGAEGAPGAITRPALKCIIGPTLSLPPNNPPWPARTDITYYGDPGAPAPIPEVNRMPKQIDRRLDNSDPPAPLAIPPYCQGFQYDSARRPTKIAVDPCPPGVTGCGELDVSVRVFEWTADNQPVLVCDPEGYPTKYEYYDNGLVHFVKRFTVPHDTGSPAFITEFHYDANGWVASTDQVVDGIGTLHTDYTRSKLGQVIRVEEKVGSGDTAPSRTTRYHYNWLGELIKTTELAGGRYERFEYNDRGLLAAVRPGYGATVTGTESSFGSSFGSGDGYDGQTTTYAYTDNGWIDMVRRVASPADTIIDYDYDAVGLVHTIKRTDSEAQFETTTTYDYDPNGRVTSEITTGPDGLGGSQILKKLTRQYDESGRLIVLCEHAENGTANSAEQDRITQYVWCRDNRLLRVVRKGNNPSDGTANLGADGVPQDGDWYEEYEYDDAVRPTHVKRPWLNPDTGQIQQVVTDLMHDQNGNIRQSQTGGRVTTYDYDFLNRQWHVQTPEGLCRYDEYPVAPWPGPTRQVWTNAGVGGGTYLRQERRKFDVLGRLLTVTLMASSSQALGTPSNPAVDPTSTYHYFADGQHAGMLEWTKDPLNRQYTRGYDELEQRNSVTDPLGSISSARLDWYGRPLERKLVEFVPTGTPLLPYEFTSQSAPLTTGQTRAYEAQGFVSSVTSAGAWNDLNLPLFGLTTSLVNTGLGQAAQVTNPRLIVSRSPSDALGQTVSTLEDMNDIGRTTQALYTRGGAVRQITALNDSVPSQTTTYRFDPQGRAVRTIYPDGRVVTAGTSIFGEPQTFTDPRGCTITTTVTLNTTDGGRVVTQSGTGPATLVGTTPQNQRFTFDRLDRLTKAETLNAADTVITTVERHYNDLGRLEWEKQTYAGDMRQVSYGYTLSGALDSVTYPDGSLLQYRQSDELDRPTQVWFAGALLAQLAYAGQRSSRIELYVPDTPGGPAPLTGDLGHDEYGRINGALWRGLNGEVIDRFETAYDDTGNPRYERADELPDTLPAPFGRHWSFAVDGVDRLTQTVSGSEIDPFGQISGLPSLNQIWTLDDLSARTYMTVDAETHAGTHTLVNEMTADVVDPDGPGPQSPQTASLVYDAAGNCLTARQTNGVGYFYHYDVFGRLVSVQDLGTAVVNTQGAVTSGTPGPLKPTYVYDALGRRVWQMLPTPGGVQTRFLYDVNWRVLEERNPAVSGQPLRKRYFWGTQDLDELWALDDLTAGYPPPRYLATRDLRHNVRTIVRYDSGIGIIFDGPSGPIGEGDGGGPDAPQGGGGGGEPSTVVVERYLYKPYGERVAIQPSNYAAISGDDDPQTTTPYPLCPFGFQGLRHDAGTFLIHVRRRYLDPVLGRWTQRDPLGYADGMNLYEGFASNPAGMIDPMGTAIGDWWDPRSYWSTFGRATDDLYFDPLGSALGALHVEQESDPTSLWEDVKIVVRELPARQIVAREVSIARLEGREIDVSSSHSTEIWARHQFGIDAMVDGLNGFDLTNRQSLNTVQSVSSFSGGLGQYLATTTVAGDAVVIGSQVPRAVAIARAASQAGRPLGYSFRLGARFASEGVLHRSVTLSSSALRLARSIPAAAEESASGAATLGASGKQLMFDFAEPETAVARGTGAAGQVSGWQATPGRVGVFTRESTPWGRTVWQRPDIDWSLERPDGLTNLEAARGGYAPMRPIGTAFEKLQLHHLNQEPAGSLAEVWRSTHRMLPHNVPPPSWRVIHPAAARAFGGEVRTYWQWRGAEAGGY